MVDDDELERHVNRVESRQSNAVPIIGGERDDQSLEERIDAMQAAARETHSELARRIRRVDEATADEAQLSQLVDRMESIESRLDDIESRLEN